MTSADRFRPARRSREFRLREATHSNEALEPRRAVSPVHPARDEPHAVDPSLEGPEVGHSATRTNALTLPLRSAIVPRFMKPVLASLRGVLRARTGLGRRTPGAHTRVACVGDSITFGQGLGPDEAYPTVLGPLAGQQLRGGQFRRWSGRPSGSRRRKNGLGWRLWITERQSPHHAANDVARSRALGVATAPPDSPTSRHRLTLPSREPQHSAVDWSRQSTLEPSRTVSRAKHWSVHHRVVCGLPSPWEPSRMRRGDQY